MWYFWVFSSTFAQTSYLFTFCFLAFPSVLIFQTQKETETKNPLFCRFCLNTSVFVANKVLIFSDLSLYMVNNTPPPTFGTRSVGQLSSENFLFFYFLFFVKYYDFANSAFLLNFEYFRKYHIFFYFCIKFHSIYFCLFLWLLWRFM